MAYRNAKSKDQKRAMEKLIEEIKSNLKAKLPPATNALSG